MARLLSPWRPLTPRNRLSIGALRALLTASSQYSGNDQSIRIWDALNGRLLHALGGKADTIWSLAFSPDGTRALSGSSDKSLKVWTLPK